MVKFYTAFVLILFSITARSQSFSMGDLVSLTSYTTAKFDNYVAKRGFKSRGFTPSADSLAYTYYDKKGKEEHPELFITKYNSEDATRVAFQTTSLAEFNKLNEQLKEEGFTYAQDNDNKVATPLVYQKANITITPITKTEEGKTVYSFLIEKKALPKGKDIAFAEDLLQLNSHEYLVAAFGEANVKKDIFYFSEKEVSKCSVLYPNTNMQVIFIWIDEANCRNISFVLIGGQLRAQSSLNYHKQIELNAWSSKQGIRAGMSLKELQKLNGEHLKFYGWESEQPGLLMKKNNGNLNFKNLGLVFNCLDCNEDKYYSSTGILSSEEMLKDNRRIYISTMVLLPDAK
jgi:hypothetical protein